MRTFAIAPALALTTLMMAQADVEESSTRPLAAPRATAGPLFQRLSAERTGVTFRSDFDWQSDRKHLYVHGYGGGGVCAGDYDGDGKPDLYLVGQLTPDRLYRQTGDLRFEDATDRARLEFGRDWGTGATFADVDGDGQLDLFACNYDAPNRLYVNRGDGTFREEAAARGLDFRGASVMAAFADYDVDGDLDAYLVTYREYTATGRAPRTRRVNGRVELLAGEEEAFAFQERVIDGETQRYLVQAGQRDRLYRNDGARFTDVSSEAGIGGNDPGFAATWWDYDGDLRPDLYVSNDFWNPDRLYHNEGDGTFRDVILESVPHTPWFSMGADFGDIDGDGLPDFIAADMAATTHYRSKIMMGEMVDSRWFLESAEPRQYMRNAVYLNTGTERFCEVAYLTGLASTDWTWSVKLGDYDGDGRLDLFSTNGSANQTFDPDLMARLRALQVDQDRRRVADPEQRAREYWEIYLSVPPQRERNLAFRNAGDLAFDDVSAAWGLDHLGFSFGAATVDLDRDGDLDLVVNNVGDEASIYRNGSSTSGTLVRLRGADRNTFGLGARVTVTTSEGTQVRQLAPVRGYMSSNEPLLHFGLGAADKIDELRIEWPRGRTQSFRDLDPGQLHTIVEPSERTPSERAPSPRPAAWFRTDALLGLAHTSVERAFDDYAAQPLLPARLSQLGPGLAWGDADGDGDADLYVGGPAGQAGTLLLREGARYAPAGGPWDAHAEREDMAALWMEVDGDGHADLFVASGGVEAPVGDERLHDRIYLGRGGTVPGAHSFRTAPDSVLPPAADSSGTAAAADFDRDGDLDLFVGGRSIPGEYPRTPRSRLLRNDDGRFVEANALAPGLERAGLVTSALWTDVDDDGWLDLLLAREWDAVGLWRNAQGTFAEQTEVSGLSERSGWWSSVVGGDFDGDGDIDYAAFNAGLNTKYSASPDKPAQLFLGDFEGTGRPALVEAKAGDGELLPVRGLSCSSSRMPFVREKLPTFHDFASAGLTDIYEPESLSEALRRSANHLASSLLVNESDSGGPRFAIRLLPRLAQVSPGYGAVAADLDADGFTDLAVVQNCYGREPETGHWDGGLGLVLRGRPDGQLEALRADASGVVIPGDATALTACDLDGDDRPDLVAARNDGELAVLRNTGEHAGVPLAVSLVGTVGNPTAIGARVTLVHSGGRRTAAEVHAGSGYLSQGSPQLFFGRGVALEACVLEVRWPDGATAAHDVAADVRHVTLRRD